MKKYSYILSLLFVFIGYLTSNTSLASTIQPVSTLQNSQWVKYQNNQYGFQFYYPKQLSIENAFGSSYLVTNNWRYGDNADTGPGKGIVVIPTLRIDNAPNNTYPHNYLSELRVGVSNAPNAVNNCIKGSSSTLQIHNITFYVFPISDAAMSHYVVGFSYRTLHNNQCYAIEQLKIGTNRMTAPAPADISDKTLQDYYYLAGKIVKTFEFTQ